jgi:hypothetical protein
MIGSTPLHLQPQFTEERRALCRRGLACSRIPGFANARVHAISLLEESGLSYSDALILSCVEVPTDVDSPLTATAFQTSVRTMRERGASKLEIASQLQRLSMRSGIFASIDRLLGEIDEALLGAEKR